MTRTAHRISSRSNVAPELPARSKPFRVSFVFNDIASSRLLAEHIRAQGLVVDCYMTGREFLRDVNAHAPGVAFVQITLTDQSICEFQEQIKSLSVQPKLVVCAGTARIPDAIRAVNNGAFEILVDVNRIDNIQQAIVRAYRSWYELDAEDLQNLTEQFEAGYERLSAREIEIFELVVEGEASRAIAAKFGISHKTVEALRANVAAKMRTDDVGHLVRMWRAANQ